MSLNGDWTTIIDYNTNFAAIGGTQSAIGYVDNWMQTTSLTDGAGVAQADLNTVVTGFGGKLIEPASVQLRAMTVAPWKSFEEYATT